MTTIVDQCFINTVYVNALFIGGVPVFPPTPVLGTNVFYGEGSGVSVTTGTNNSGFGYFSLNQLTEGNFNVAVGSNAARDLTLGEGAIMIGNIGNTAQEPFYNTFIGNDSIPNCGNTTRSIVIGTQHAMFSPSFRGFETIIIGTENASNMGFNSRSVIIGTRSGRSISGASETVILGNNLANTVTDMPSSTIVGFNSVNSAAILTQTITLGSVLVNNVTNSTRTVAIGNNLGNAITGSVDNIFMGINSARNAGTVDSAVIIGVNSVDSPDSEIVVIGCGIAAGAGDAVIQSVVIGGFAASAASVNKSTVIGRRAMGNITNLANAVVIGTNAGTVIPAGAVQMIAIGTDVLANNVSAVINTVIGIGNSALLSGGTVLFRNTVCMGHFSMPNIAAIDAALTIGNNVMTAAAIQSIRTTIIGHDTLTLATDVTDIISIGSANMPLISAATIGHIVMGNTSLTVATNMQGVIAVGHNTIKASANVLNVTAIGNNALINNNTTLIGLIAIGNGAMSDTLNITDCIAIGQDAMRDAVGSLGTIAVGHFCLPSMDNIYTIGVGEDVGSSFTLPSTECVLMGYSTLSNATSAIRSVVIGAYAQSASTFNTTDSILIGQRVLDGFGANNLIAIGRVITNSIPASPEPGNSVLIGNGSRYVGDNNVTVGNLAGPSTPNVAGNMVIIGQGSGILRGSDNVTAVGAASYRIQTDALDSIFIGYLNGAARNLLGDPSDTITESVGVGTRALSGLTITNSVAVGNYALQFADVVSNTIAIGYNAGTNGGNFSDTTIIGTGSLNNNSTATTSTVVGHQIAINTSTITNCVAVGTLIFNQTPAMDRVVALGNEIINTVGAAVETTTAAGHRAFRELTGGSQNVAVGFDSGVGVLTANQNTYLGALATSPDGLTNATAIGYNAIAPASNSVRIGNTNVNLIEAQVPITVTSDIRAKNEITNLSTDMKKVMDVLKEVNIVRYQLNNDTRKRAGVIAQELDAVLEKHDIGLNMVEKPADPEKLLSVRYDDLFSLLVLGFQNLTERIEKIEAKLQ